MPLSSPVELQHIQIHGGDTTLVVPRTGTLTPTANALELLFVGNGGAGDDADFTSIDTPAYLTGPWTQIAYSAPVGADFCQVAAFWGRATAAPSADNTQLSFAWFFQNGTTT